MASSANLKFAKPISNGALKSSDLPSRIKVLGWGKSKTLDGDIFFDAKSAECLYTNQKAIGRVVAPLDFNHNTVQGTKAYTADKEPRAIAGYGVVTVVPDDGVYYEYMNYTPSGEKSARDYIDLSPAVITDEEDRVIGIHSVALTPAGQIDNLQFYNADSLSLYSADSMPNLMDKCSVKVNSKTDGDFMPLEKLKDGGDGMKSTAYAADLSRGSKVKVVESEYADTAHKKYPINTEGHVRAAWSYIHMPKNQGGYSEEEISAIKRRIAAKAKHFGIELKSESADERAKVNAYVDDPYQWINTMLEDHLKFFRAELHMEDDAEPDDVMKMLRAKWEGFKTVEQPLPSATPGNKQIPGYGSRGGPTGFKPGEQGTPDETASELEHPGSVHGAITYSAESIEKLLTAKLAPLSAELETLKTERDNNAKKAAADQKNLETEQRKNLQAEATRAGKVIPLSAEDIETIPVETLKKIVGNLKPEVNFEHVSKRGVKPLSSDGKTPDLKGARERSAQKMTEWFASQREGVIWTGPSDLGKALPN
jgi:hypothetical protein